MSPTDVSMRVVADHMRATTFLIADGVMPSNEWRGYVLRKIMRRAMRHGKHLGFTEPFLHSSSHVLDREMGDAYPELRRNREMIEKTILAEENRFDAVLHRRAAAPRGGDRQGARHAGDACCPATRRSSSTTRSACRYDFIEDTAATQGVTVDRDGFERAMEAQRDKARAQSAFGGEEGRGVRDRGRRRDAAQAPAISSRATRPRA